VNRFSRLRSIPAKIRPLVYDRHYPHDMRTRVLMVLYKAQAYPDDLCTFARTDEDSHTRVMRVRFGFRDDPDYKAEPRTFRLEKIANRTKLQYRFTKRFACWKNVRDIGKRE
jgi:hypothetical protein